MGADGHGLTLLGIMRRNLVRQPVRTGLTVLGVSLGVVAIVAFNSLVRGPWAAMEAAIRTGGAAMIVYQAGVAAALFRAREARAPRARLRADPDVDEVASALFHIMPVAGQPFVLLFGSRADEFPARTAEMIKGRVIAADDEVVLGAQAERALRRTVGDEVAIGGRTFRVVGIFESEVVFFNGGVVMPLEPLQGLLGRPDQVTAFLVKLRPGADPRPVAARIEEDGTLVAIGSAAEYRKVDRGLEIAEGMVWAISIMAVVIGSIIVTNTMWMAVYERTREIGLLRAVGWSRRAVIGLIVLEALGVGLMACLVGSALGAGLAELVTRLPIAAQFNRVVFGVEPFVLALVVAVLLSVVGALAPAWRAARISPAEALRYE